MYYNSVGRNSTLIVGITPDPDGLIPQPDVNRMKEWGDEIRKQFGSPIARTSGKGDEFIINLNETTPIDRIVIQENIRFGERVREFIAEGFRNGKWTKFAADSCIGHKLILRFDPVRVSEVKLRITKSIDKVRIIDFAVYKIE